MNERDRTELQEALAKLQFHYPEWRLGQLVANVAGWADRDVWDIEDEDFLAAAKDHLRTLVERQQEAPT
ncbi:MAG: hypothetical protein WD669_01395 [Pirellulales bacterium]